MTISFKTGAWTSRTSTGTDVITGVGFQPKVILVFATQNLSNTTDNTFAKDFEFYFGAAVDTTAANQRSLMSESFGGNPGSSAYRCWSGSCVFARSVGGITAKAAVSAIGSDGFTVNWSVIDGTAHRLYYICIGGTDITNTKTGEITAPTTTGNVSYTGPGFKPDFLMLWGDLGTSVDTEGRGSSFGIGFATSSTKQVALANASKDSSITSAAKRYQRGDNVINFIELDPGTPTAGAFGGSLVSMDSTGFTINWSSVATAGQSKLFGYLAIKGGTWVVGSATGGTSSSQTVSGLGITPVGVLLASVGNASSTAINANARLSFGGGSGSADSRCVWSGDRDAVTTTIGAMVQKSTKCITVITENATASSSTVTCEASISALASDSFTLSWSTTTASAIEFLYVAIGPTGATNQNVTKTLSESIAVTHNTPTFVKTKAPKLAVPPVQTITISDTGQPTKVVKHNKLATVPPESISIGDNLSYTRSIGGHFAITKSLIEILSLSGAPTTTVTSGHHNIIKTLLETIRFSDSVNYVGKTKHTGDPGYWLPLQPRITIYAFTDTTYSSPLYQYNPFTDGSGGIDKPVGLHFESIATSAGTFSLDIDNSSDTYDPDLFARGNRVTIECSKDGNTWFHAFHGLVRSAKQKVFGPGNRIISVQGYSYLIRLGERILSARKEATILGNFYDMNDTTMNTDNLINNLLTDDTNYAHTIDDTQLYPVFKTSNITASPIEDWIARIDAPLVTAADAVNSILEFSQSFLSIDYSNDQLVLFNPDRTPSGGANAFLLTDNINLQADSSQYTMYPIADYTYQISYDFADSANRLISSIGNTECPGQTILGQTVPGSVGAAVYSNDVADPVASVGALLYNFFSQSTFVGFGPTSGPPKITRLAISIQNSSQYGKVLSRISFAFRVSTSVTTTGTITAGIWKSADDSFISFGSLDISTIPTDGLYHGYDFTFLGNTYALQQFDHVGCINTNSNNPVFFAMYQPPVSGNPVHRLDDTVTPKSWASDSVLATDAPTGRMYDTTYDTSNWATIAVTTTIRGVGILVSAGSALVGAQIGRITFSVHTNGTHPVGSWQIGIRRGSDNTFINYGNGPFTSIAFEDSTFRNYSFDAVNNTYKLAVSDRVVFEGTLTSGTLVLECSKDGGSPQSVQTFNGTTWAAASPTTLKLGGFLYLTNASQQPDTVIQPCGGLPDTQDASDVLHIAVDANNIKRVGMVEQVLSNLPSHVKTFQTLRDYSFNKLYTMGKPRFTFDYPSVTVPAIIPKAGDIVCHVSKKANVGKDRTAIQTGVITQVTYDFVQNDTSILGLRRISLTTTGVLRGSY